MNLTHHFLARLLLSCFSLTLLAGCGGSEERRPDYLVKGIIQLDGKPLESGSIVLDPADGIGQPASGGIVNGEIQEFRAQEGKKIVRISAAPKETGEKDEYGEPITESIIPAKYNVNTTLETEIQPNDENRIEFNLDSK